MKHYLSSDWIFDANYDNLENFRLQTILVSYDRIFVKTSSSINALENRIAKQYNCNFIAFYVISDNSWKMITLSATFGAATLNRQVL